jgi:hypothetical protein
MFNAADFAEVQTTKCIAGVTHLASFLPMSGELWAQLAAGDLCLRHADEFINAQSSRCD